MKQILLGSVGALALIFAGSFGTAHAQMMGGYGNSGYYGMMGDGYYQDSAQATQAAPADAADEPSATGTSTDSSKGSVLWQQLQNKQLSCSQLTTDDFDALGDYVMGAMMGSADEPMDQWMTARWGTQNTEEMHVVMGERLSGCNTSAAYPDGYGNYFPMMGMMLSGYGYGMVPRYGFGYGNQDWYSLILAAFVGALVALIAVLLIRVLRR